MIDNIHVEGFKCFVDEKFTIKPLTVLSGLNSSGKSSLLQAIRLLWEGKPLPGHGPLNELISSHCKELKISANAGEVGFSYSRNEIQCWGDLYKDKNLFSYLSAGRLGPRPSLPLWLESGLNDVGEHGEYVIDYLSRNEELSGLPENLRHEDANSSAVRLNAAAWLKMVSPGIEFDFLLNRKMDIGTAEYSDRRPTNVGFGLSYTLPLIVNALIYAALITPKSHGAKEKKDKAIILIENPEAHLHPAGQTKLGIFLSLVASAGVKVVLETHSDHLLNGIRLSVKNKKLNSDDSAFYFFSYDFKEEQSRVTRPLIDEYGMFDEWPDGFFDETVKVLGELI